MDLYTYIENNASKSSRINILFKCTCNILQNKSHARSKKKPCSVNLRKLTTKHQLLGEKNTKKTELTVRRKRSISWLVRHDEISGLSMRHISRERSIVSWWLPPTWNRIWTRHQKGKSVSDCLIILKFHILMNHKFVKSLSFYYLCF